LISRVRRAACFTLKLGPLASPLAAIFFVQAVVDLSFLLPVPARKPWWHHPLCRTFAFCSRSAIPCDTVRQLARPLSSYFILTKSWLVSFLQVFVILIRERDTELLLAFPGRVNRSHNCLPVSVSFKLPRLSGVCCDRRECDERERDHKTFHCSLLNRVMHGARVTAAVRTRSLENVHAREPGRCNVRGRVVADIVFDSARSFFRGG
jgi:hypothetical protein